MRQYPNPPRVLKKIIKLVLNPFIKIELYPIRGGVGTRIPKKLTPLPSLNLCLHGRVLKNKKIIDGKMKKFITK